MDEKLRGMGVNTAQRKALMAASRFGIGPLAQMGLVKKDPVQMHVDTSAPMALALPLSASRSGRALGGSASGSQQQRSLAMKKLLDDDGLDDVAAFLGSAKKQPMSIIRPAGQSLAGMPALASAGPAAASSWAGAKKNEEIGSEVRMAPKTLEVKMAPKLYVPEAETEIPLPPDEMRATASSAGARAKAAAFKPIQGPTVEQVRKQQLLYEPAATKAMSPVLEAAIAEIREEELRRAKKDEKRRREEWRKEWKENKQKKKDTASKLGKPQADEESDGDDSCEGSEGSGSSLEKRRRLGEEKPSELRLDGTQRKFWGESVKGRVSNDNKGFTDAELEKRFLAQQARDAKVALMTEAQVLAMLKGDSGKDKAKQKVPKKEKTKERQSSRSRERRR